MTNADEIRDFQGKVALVTGAAGGIGRAAAELFARRGAKLVLCDIADASETLAAISAQGGEALYHQTDVSKAEDVESSVRRAIEAYGRLDYAFNNAGIAAPGAPVADIDPDDWHRVIAVNLTGLFWGLKFQIPEILKTGGAIVNNASILAFVAAPGQGVYAVTKHAIAGLTRSAAIDHGAAGIRINAVAPGVTRTPMIAAAPSEFMDEIVSRSPQNRYGQPHEVAQAAVWLCSPAASFVNGVVLPVDGGWLAG